MLRIHPVRALSLIVLIVLGVLTTTLLVPAQAADTTITLSSQASVMFAINMVVGVLLPLLSQTITNIQASDTVKTVINLLIAALIGVATPFATGQQSFSNIDWAVLGLSVVQIWMLSIVSHYGLWKPTGVTGTDGVIANKVPGGVGGTSADISPVGYETVPPYATATSSPDPAVIATDSVVVPAPVADPTTDPSAVDPNSVGADVVPPAGTTDPAGA